MVKSKYDIKDEDFQIFLKNKKKLITLMDNCEKCPRSANIASEPGYICIIK